MPRFFSSSQQLAKTLKWKLNGTTDNVGWAKPILENAVDVVPRLRARVDSAVINGNPHSTRNDPLHATGVLGRGSIKGNNRETSFHVYPDGRVVFSDKTLPQLQVTASGVRTLPNTVAGTLSAPPTAQQQNDQHAPQQGSQSSSTAPAGWAYNAQRNAYEYWDGTKYVHWQYSATANDWVHWDGQKWVKHSK
ncbi:MAG: hypothetical protein M1828_004992 [Chrysothrix sp. TS-e1954]|nr:MAG: hypothetical protein M1828_004992 [Chrysothrix sp. TS-e1954]